MRNISDVIESGVEVLAGHVSSMLGLKDHSEETLVPVLVQGNSAPVEQAQYIPVPDASAAPLGQSPEPVQGTGAPVPTTPVSPLAVAPISVHETSTAPRPTQVDSVPETSVVLLAETHEPVHDTSAPIEQPRDIPVSDAHSGSHEEALGLTQDASMPAKQAPDPLVPLMFPERPQFITIYIAPHIMPKQIPLRMASEEWRFRHRLRLMLGIEPSLPPEAFGVLNDEHVRVNAEEENNVKKDETANPRLNSIAGGQQIGMFNFTTDPEVCWGTHLGADNRWVVLHDKLFVNNEWMKEAEALYKVKAEIYRNKTADQKYREKLSWLVDSEEASQYASNLCFDEVEKFNIKYSTPSEDEKSGKKSNKGRKPIPFQRALAVLIIQRTNRTSDREMEHCVAESPYLQYFCGYEQFRDENFVPHSTISELKNIFDCELISKINEIFIKSEIEIRLKEQGKEQENEERKDHEGDDGQKAKEAENAGLPANKGTLSVDGTACPNNITYPMDFKILNEARQTLEKSIDKAVKICIDVKHPRTQKKKMQKTVQNLSKNKHRTRKDVRKVNRLLLNSIERDFRFLDEILKSHPDYELTKDEAYDLTVAKYVYCQQKYMYEKDVLSVPHRIVSFSMPFVRPIVRGKTVNKVEFGPKCEVSKDGDGFSRVERFSFESFNEGTDLQKTLENYKEKHGYYPEVVRVDQIYRNKENRALCKKLGIRMSGPRLGRKPKNEEVLKEQMAMELADMTDRIEIEREFARDKHCFGLDKVVERTPATISHAVYMGVFLGNLIPVGFST